MKCAIRGSTARRVPRLAGAPFPLCEERRRSELDHLEGRGRVALHAAVPALAVTRAIAEGPCCYCHQPLTISNFSADHTTPRGRGGDHSLENLTICCHDCNTAKGALSQAEWVQLLALLDSWPEEIARNTLARLKAAEPGMPS